MTPRLTLRTIAAGLVILLCIVAAVAVLMALDARKDAKRAAAGKTLSDGRTAAAQDASAVRDRADERIAEINAAVKESTDEIRNAPDPASRDRAALRGLCRIDPGASPDCRLLDADPGRVD